MPDLFKFPDYFKSYQWRDKHHLYGYPADCFPEFQWIKSLETRFLWQRENYAAKQTASVYLLKEMLQWGGGQNGVLQKFEDQQGEVNLLQLIEGVVNNLGTPSEAIANALLLPGMGLTYASKLLRFLSPEEYGALDSRLRRALGERIKGQLPTIYDGNVGSMRKGYEAFLSYLSELKAQLESKSIVRPMCSLPRGTTQTGWRAADIEMALFCWAESGEP